MKNRNMKKTTALALSVAVLMGVGLSACSSAPENKLTPHASTSTTATATESASASATPKASAFAKATESKEALTQEDLKTMTEQEIQDWTTKHYLGKYGTAMESIDIDAAVAGANKSVKQTFPKVNTKKAVEFGLTFMDDVISSGNLYDTDPKNDKLVLEDSRISDRMDGKYISHVKSEFKKKGYWPGIVAAKKDGLMGTVEDSKGNKVKIAFDGVPLNQWNTPDVYVQSIGKGADAEDTIAINGTRTVDFKFKNGLKADNVEVEYWVFIIPTGDGKFLVRDMGYRYDNIKVDGVK